MTALTAADIADLDQEIAQTREQISHLNGSLAKPWNQQQADKMLIQRTAALTHLERLKALRATA